MKRRAYLTAKERYAVMSAQQWKCGCGCGAPVWPGAPVEYDHTLPLALGGSAKPDCALTRWCHREKTSADIARISKAERQKKAHLGLKRRRGRKLEGKGFQSKPEGYKYRWPKRRVDGSPVVGIGDG